VRLAPGKSTRPYLKNELKQKGLGEMGQVVEHLPSKLQDPEFKSPEISKK
jgi:hypothetical protein